MCTQSNLLKQDTIIFNQWKKKKKTFKNLNYLHRSQNNIELKWNFWHSGVHKKLILLTEVVTDMHSINFLFFPIISINCNFTGTFSDNIKDISNSTLLMEFLDKCKKCEKYYPSIRQKRGRGKSPEWYDSKETTALMLANDWSLMKVIEMIIRREYHFDCNQFHQYDYSNIYH